MRRETAVETMSMAGMQQVCGKECVVKSVVVLTRVAVVVRGSS